MSDLTLEVGKALYSKRHVLAAFFDVTSAFQYKLWYTFTKVIGQEIPGGVLNPLLYLIYVSDIAKGIPKSISINQFAVDIEMRCSILPIKKCKKDLEYAANSIFSQQNVWLLLMQWML